MCIRDSCMLIGFSVEKNSPTSRLSQEYKRYFIRQRDQGYCSTSHSDDQRSCTILLEIQRLLHITMIDEDAVLLRWRFKTTASPQCYWSLMIHSSSYRPLRPTIGPKVKRINYFKLQLLVLLPHDVPSSSCHIPPFYFHGYLLVFSQHDRLVIGSM